MRACLRKLLISRNCWPHILHSRSMGGLCLMGGYMVAGLICSRQAQLVDLQIYHTTQLAQLFLENVRKDRGGLIGIGFINQWIYWYCLLVLVLYWFGCGVINMGQQNGVSRVTIQCQYIIHVTVSAAINLYLKLNRIFKDFLNYSLMLLNNIF